VEWTGILDCADGYFWAAPVGSLSPNGFGVYDMIGNVWEWTADCWRETYAGAPVDASAWDAGPCRQRTYRGGSWNMSAANLRVSYRGGLDPNFRNVPRGFRLARDASGQQADRAP
jgi:formylglycine-generating enzyme required for sulfatase activity